jgi:hypothetical protein
MRLPDGRFDFSTGPNKPRDASGAPRGPTRQPLMKASRSALI